MASTTIVRAGSHCFVGNIVVKSAFLVCWITLAALASAQNSTSSSPPLESISPDPQAPAGAASQAPAGDDDQNGFVFKKAIEEVVLRATVVDNQNRLITDLAGNNFAVYEDGKLQAVTSFRKERVPVSLGILIDNSGSMLPKRAKVNEAAMQLVDGSQEGDRVFVVNFGDDAFLDQDYTQDVGKLRAALQRIETRGSTALYDALIASADHLNQSSQLQKKILLAVTDGRDNASQATFDQVLHKLQSKNGPVLYIIALEQDQQRVDDRRSLTTLAERTGGTAYFPSSLDEIESITRAIARDIRSQYVITYRSSNPHASGVYHSIQVQALAGSAPLRVQTRAGYYSGELEAEQSH